MKHTSHLLLVLISFTLRDEYTYTLMRFNVTHLMKMDTEGLCRH